MHRKINGTVAASQAHTGPQATSALPERACTPEARAHRRVGHGRGRGEERRVLGPRARRRGAAQRQHGRQDIPRAVRERAVLRNLKPVELDDGQVLPARTAASGAPRRDLPTSGARGAAALRRAGRGVRAVCAQRGAGRRGQQPCGVPPHARSSALAVVTAPSLRHDRRCSLRAGAPGQVRAGAGAPGRSPC